MKKLLCLLILVLPLMFGCEKDINPENVSNAILISFKNYYNNPQLSSSEKTLYNQFIEQEKKENKVIELNNYFDDYNRTLEPDTNGVFLEKGKYYINYNDLEWQETEADDDADSKATAHVIANGYNIYLSIEDFPILYDEVHYGDNYSYAYLGTIEDDDNINMYYKSHEDSSGLIIQYKKEKNKIVSVNLINEAVSSYVEPENKSSKVTGAVEIVAILAAFGFLAYGTIKFIKSRR